MSYEETKKVSRTLVAGLSEYGTGKIIGRFEADRYGAEPLLDTRVELTIAPFAITWEKKEELMGELEELLAKYQI